MKIRVNKHRFIAGPHRKVWERPYPEYAKDKKILKDEVDCWVAKDKYTKSNVLEKVLLEDFRKTLFLDSCENTPFTLNKLVLASHHGGFLILENGEVRGSSGFGFFSGTYRVK